MECCELHPTAWIKLRCKNFQIDGHFPESTVDPFISAPVFMARKLLWPGGLTLRLGTYWVSCAGGGPSGGFLSRRPPTEPLLGGGLRIPRSRAFSTQLTTVRG